LYLAALGVIFVAMARLVLPMAFGSPGRPGADGIAEGRAGEPAWSVVPPLALGLIALILGVFVPEPLWNALRQAASAAGVH
jgi:formate hydrogenlyase subunit 3/multisubunit Na+/H+ antiporter MnhD subunit